MQLGTKSETLKYFLDNKLKNADVLPLVYFKYESWVRQREVHIREILTTLNVDEFIVRSSSTNEDTNQLSNAGAFLTKLNVNIEKLESSIDEVFSSYGSPKAQDQVLIQPMLSNVTCSGVVFSREPNFGSPYRIVSWSEKGDTDQITKGEQSDNTFIINKNIKTKYPRILGNLGNLVSELETIYDSLPLDIEFAITKSGNKSTLWLLQVRKLILQKQVNLDEQNFTNIQRIEEYLTNSMKPHPFLMGETTAFGIMPDWNPAEIIGVNPRPLAKSLYKELITDAIWAYQRNNYGYRNLRSFPLLIELGGLPYIDVRVSFNSFVPGDLDNQIAEKLVNFYLKKIKKSPFLHDKIEFDIVISCIAFDFEQRSKDLLKNGFDKNEIAQIKNSLLQITNNILCPENGLMFEDKKRVEKLCDRRELILKSNQSKVEKIYWLLEDCKRYGTLPFAGLARAAFISVQFLNSLVGRGILSKDEVENFLGTIDSVTAHLEKDSRNLPQSEFLRKYGHLRPGTYDITSYRYDEDPEQYFSKDFHTKINKEFKKREFKITIDQFKSIDALLELHKINLNAIQLFSFIKEAIALREFSKFEFTKNLSAALKLLCDIGEELDIDREKLSFLNVKSISYLYGSTFDQKEVFLKSIKEGKAKAKNQDQIILPPLITEPSQAGKFMLPEFFPNYVTNKLIVAPVVDIKQDKNISGSIVCIPSADPGFDWLFSRNIAGLVTAWGGVNSHMAIRAGELGIPALIGAGDKIFNQIRSASSLSLDCSSKRFEILN